MTDILYGASPDRGSGFQLKDTIECIGKNEIKTAGYKNTTDGNLNWTLDGIQGVNDENFRQFVSDIKKFDPQLVLIDHSLKTEKACLQLEIKNIWYVSSHHQIGGLKWKYKSLGRSAALINNIRWELDHLKDQKKFIISPFAEFVDLELHPGYKLLKPKHLKVERKPNNKILIFNSDVKRLKIWDAFFQQLQINYGLHCDPYSDAYIEDLKICDWAVHSGENRLVADCLHNGIPQAISAHHDNGEGVINGALLNYYKLGQNLGEWELFNQFAVDLLQRDYENKILPPPSNNKMYLELYQEIENYVRFKYAYAF